MIKKLVVIASVLALGACGKSKWDSALNDFEGLKDRMCDCKEASCAEAVEKDIDTWKSSLKDKMHGERPPKDIDERGAKLRQEMRECERKIAKS
jgi:hypothetical protein